MKKKAKFTFNPENKKLLEKAAKALDEDQLDLFKSVMEESSSAISTRPPFPEGTFNRIVVPPR